MSAGSRTVIFFLISVDFQSTNSVVMKCHYSIADLPMLAFVAASLVVDYQSFRLQKLKLKAFRLTKFRVDGVCGLSPTLVLISNAPGPLFNPT